MERIAKHRALALSYQGKDLGGVRVILGQDLVDIRYPDKPTASHPFWYEDFPEWIESKIKSFTANQGGASMQRSDNLCSCIENPINITPDNTKNISTDNFEIKEKEVLREKLAEKNRITKKKGEERKKLMEENRSYANPYHKQAYGNVLIFVFDSHVSFNEVGNNDVLNDFLSVVSLYDENFKPKFKGELNKHNFPLLELCEVRGMHGESGMGASDPDGERGKSKRTLDFVTQKTLVSATGC